MVFKVDRLDGFFSRLAQHSANPEVPLSGPVRNKMGRADIWVSTTGTGFDTGSSRSTGLTAKVHSRRTLEKRAL